MASLSGLRRQIDSLARWMIVLDKGLIGQRQHLWKTEGWHFRKAMERIGVQMLSVTGATKKGLELKRGAKPIVTISLGEPIGFVDFYCAEQFKPKRPKKSKAAQEQSDGQ